MGDAREKSRFRRVRKLLVFGSLAAAVVAWRERQMAKNSAP